ncbi:lytic transglycosylase domain-containing protein [Paenibacillus sp. MBLB2552]|uniref:Lytic transglycosylase domain-containing protein n=1 Tax=Paenibacillus mellifer TaxID=2937794 RepID=A0A9X1Y5R2_9BACL|nr:lytic transglycosylase domain-containing protein [Paenibacillus mellifer]MCK8487867.1 lytic transglycosylase domain-containing protein [Paenibacillus mellifer]
MQIDPRTMGQLIQLQSLNQLDLQGTSAQRASSDMDGSLFDILLQEMMLAEQDANVSADSAGTDARSVLESLQRYLYSAGSNDSDTLDDLFSEVFSNSEAVTAMRRQENSTVLPSESPADLQSLITQASARYGVPESLIKAVIATESSFNSQAVSSAGAKGLMQLMDGTARGLGVSNPFDPAQNIDGGTKYLSYQINRYGGDVKTALAAYNAGPGRLQRLGIGNDEQLMEKFRLLPQETQGYIAKIMRAQAKFEA